MNKTEILILGSGLSGLSSSYHIGHGRCHILEKNEGPFGHVRSSRSADYTWDLGPHVSFTKSEYVKDLFARNVGGEFNELDANVGNYYAGSWVDHPVQSNLYQVPEPLRSKCVESFLETSRSHNDIRIKNYRDWLNHSLGRALTDNFFAPYTRKYWTTDPENLGTDWISSRVYKPTIDDVINGANGKPGNNNHYITKARYPKSGGFQSFAENFAVGANITTNKKVVKVDPRKRVVTCEDMTKYSYDKLIVTIPLPEFVRTIEGLNPSVTDAAEKLACSQLLLINVEVPHTMSRQEQWLYVYDEEKLSTRISFTEKLSNNNSPSGCSGIQVEVYFSRYRRYKGNGNEIAKKVLSELVEMGLIQSEKTARECVVNFQFINYANIIFDHARKKSLELIFDSLAALGLSRRDDELDATTSWNSPGRFNAGNIFLSGRFGEWKYYWSDDCVLSGKHISNSIRQL